MGVSRAPAPDRVLAVKDEQVTGTRGEQARLGGDRTRVAPASAKQRRGLLGRGIDAENRLRRVVEDIRRSVGSPHERPEVGRRLGLGEGEQDCAVDGLDLE